MNFPRFMRTIKLFDRRKEPRASQCLVEATNKHKQQTELVLAQAEAISKLIRGQGNGT